MQVHTFPLVTTLYADTRFPLQHLGNGEPPEASQVELSVLLAWMQSNLTLPDMGVSTATVTVGVPSVSIAAGKLVEKIVVIGSSGGTFSLGTTVGGSQILSGENYDTGGVVYAFDKYFAASGSLFFSGFTGTLTVKIYAR